MRVTFQPKQLKVTPPARVTPAPTGLVQRQCACGGTPGLDGECATCRRKQLSVQHLASDNHQPAPLPPAAAAAAEPGHHFGRVRIHHNAAVDEEPGGDEPDSGELGQEFPGQAQPTPVEAMPAVTDEELTPGVQPLEGGEKPKVKCPTKTVVEKTIDMTPDGIKKGYRTGYGATAVMKVEPDSTNWDGTQIVESLKQTKNTCPQEFGISPCSGNSTFTVGAGTKSSVLGDLEAKRNQFYDFHISRWNKGSLLHDRNPNNVDSCQVECEQKYSCGDAVIGSHTVTRTFTKGKSGSRDVTLVAVTKK